MTPELMCIKDADGLDRVRINDLPRLLSGRLDALPEAGLRRILAHFEPEEAPKGIKALQVKSNLLVG